MTRIKRKGLYFFVTRDENGEERRENPPINFNEMQEMYGSGDLLDTSELSMYAGWSNRSIYKLRDEYGLPYIKIGRNYYFSKEKIREWNKQRKKQKKRR